MTVIFLPLSAVSSIFGMNTVDIRDMEQGDDRHDCEGVDGALLSVLGRVDSVPVLCNSNQRMMPQGRLRDGKPRREL